MPRLAIIGLGLIGGSIGLALKRAKLADLEVTGCDTGWDVAARARKLGAIDRDAKHAAAAVEGAAVVVIAAPISQLPSIFEAIAPALGEGAVVTDTASTKGQVLRWAEELLPDSVSFVGGHPIAGKETPGLDAAEASLFDGRPWALCPSVRADENAVRAIENLIALTGAHSVLIDAAEHDSYLAAVSHLPLIAAGALFSLASSGQAWPELAALAGPGFRDTTRLASTSPDLSQDICLTNRDNIVHWLDRYVDELRRFRDLIADTGGSDQLAEAFARIQNARDAFLQAPPTRPRPSTEPDVMSAGDRMLSFMVGEYVVRRTKEVQQMVERMESGDKRGSR